MEETGGEEPFVCCELPDAGLVNAHCATDAGRVCIAPTDRNARCNSSLSGTPRRGSSDMHGVRDTNSMQ